MKKKTCKYISLAATFAICSSLIACSDESKKIPTLSSVSSITQETITTDMSKVINCNSIIKTFPKECWGVVQMRECSLGGGYFVCVDKDMNKLIYRSDQKFYTFEVLSAGRYNRNVSPFLAPSEDGGAYVLAVTVSYGDLLEPDYEDPDLDWSEYEEAAVYTAAIDKFNAEGEFVSSTELSDLPEDFMTSSSFVYGFEKLNDGGFVIFSGSKIAKIGNDGKIQTTAELPVEHPTLSCLDRDGKLVCFSNDNNGTIIYTISPETFKVEKTENIGEYSWVNSVTAGNDEYRLYISLNDGIYVLEDGSQALCKLVDATNSGLNQAATSYVLPLENGSFVTAGNVSGSDRNVPQIAIISERSAEAVKETQTLKIAMLGPNPDEYIALVNNFNTLYDGQYRVEIDSTYVADEKDFSHALDEAIITGDVPDIVAAMDYSVLLNLAGKNALADLYPMIESDPDLSIDAFMPNIIEAYEFEGRLPVIPIKFKVSTMAAKDKFLGGVGENWTYAEMIETINNLPQGTYVNLTATDPEQMFFEFLFHNIASFVDYENATCSFDSEEFVNLLEICKNCEKYVPVDESQLVGDETVAYYEEYAAAYKNDVAFLSEKNFWNYRDYRDCIEETFGNEPITFVGDPSSDRNGTKVSASHDQFAIMEGSENKEGAWAFVRQFYLEEYQNGSLISGFSPIEAYNDFKNDEFEALVKSARKTSSYDYDIMEICEEEAAYYFNGEHTAQETADIIQNRIAILVSEQS